MESVLVAAAHASTPEKQTVQYMQRKTNTQIEQLVLEKRRQEWQSRSPFAKQRLKNATRRLRKELINEQECAQRRYIEQL